VAAEAPGAEDGGAGDGVRLSQFAASGAHGDGAADGPRKTRATTCGAQHENVASAAICAARRKADRCERIVGIGARRENWVMGNIVARDARRGAIYHPRAGLYRVESVMTSTGSVLPALALENSLQALVEEKPDEALRWAVPAVGDPGVAPVAADLIGRALALTGEADLARAAYAKALPLLMHQGRVTQAIACALAVRDLDGGTDALDVLANTFGSDAAEGAVIQPPALTGASVMPLAAGASRDERVKAARAAIDALRAAPADGPRHARLPLWGALPSVVFRRLLDTMYTQIYGAGTTVMTEGEAGSFAMVIARGEVQVVRRSTGVEPIELARLGAGVVVGEMALVTDAPRAASVISLRGTMALVLPRQAVDQAAAEVPALGEQLVAFCHRRLVENVFRTSTVLRTLPASERNGLAPLFVTKTFEPGQCLLEADRFGAGLHVIASGHVEVLGKESGGEAVQIARLGAGHCVGEISLMLRRPATATVRACGPVVSLMLPANRFLETVRDRPTLLAQLYQLAVTRDDETASVLGQQAEQADDLVMV